MTQALRETNKATWDGIKFKIMNFDDGRPTPYVIMFTSDEVKSVYRFDAAGVILKVVADSERYKIVYNSRGELVNVRRRDSGVTRSRTLIASEEHVVVAATNAGSGGEGKRGDIAIEHHGRRRLYACDDCENTWDLLCDTGLPPVCALQTEYGSVFDTLGAASIDTMCSTFASACGGISAFDACDGQCEDEDDDDEDDPCGGACGSGAECNNNSDEGECVCPEGYLGDPYESCTGKLLFLSKFVCSLPRSFCVKVAINNCSTMGTPP